MGFGCELQGSASHAALLSLQDAELRLLESIKKCVTQRIKCDRDYATALANVVSTAQKLDPAPDFNSPTFLAWNTIIKETENVIQLIRDNAEKLVAKTLERLVQVINEKKAAKKFYGDEHSRLESDFAKVEETMLKHRSEYEKMVGKVVVDRAKFEDTCRKARAGTKVDECRQRYVKSESKLQRVHNDYVCSLHNVSLSHKHYSRTMLPALLDLQQSTQQAFIQQCKEILEEYVQYTDLTAEPFAKSHHNMQKSIQGIKPPAEYDDFLNKYRSDPIQANKYEFDQSLLNDYKGTVLADEVILNDLTFESLQMSRSQQHDNLFNCQRRLENKTQELQDLEATIQQMGNDHANDEILKNTHASRLRTAEQLRREIIELQCDQDRHQALYDLIQAHFMALGDQDPPPGLHLPDLDDGQASQLREEDEAPPQESLAKKISDIKSTLAKRNFFKRPGLNHQPPNPPAKDFPVNHALPDLPTTPQPPTPEDQQPNGQPKGDKVSPASGQDGYQQFNFHEERHQEMTTTSGRRLDEEEWFHGVLPREEVQKMLQKDGDYLVRESKNRKTGEMQYVLSVMWNGHKHFIIQGCEGCWKFEGDAYPTIQELIVAQHRSNAAVTKKSEAIIRRPILRPAWELLNDDIELIQKIGNGNFGEVFRGIYKPRGMEVAVKTCREALSDEFKKKFLQEGQILMQYDHPNIVRFIGIAAQRQPVMIVMEYVPGGSLLNFLKKKGAKQQKKSLVKMCEDAAAGMAYLEEKGCIHRDLAARNCLVDEKNNITKISDFGMSREDKEYQVSGGLKQIPIKWTAPEALNYGTYTSACDVWSFGILMWEVFAFGVIPYQGLTNTQAMEKVDEGYRMPPPDGCPQAVYDLMLQCWNAEPRDRPKFSQLQPELHRIRTSSSR